MHIGLAGAGRMGEFHAEVLAAQPGVRSVTITDPDPKRAAAVAAKVDGRVVGSAEDLIDAGIDALVIAAATPAHAPLIHLAADATLPTFCEKPIALDLAATDAAVAHAEVAGIYLQIGFQRRFDHGFCAARGVIARGELGRLSMVRVAMYDPAPPPLDYLRVSGGIFRDMHIHDFDAVRFVTGQEVLEVYADGTVLVDEAIAELGDVDTTSLVLRLSGGAMVVLAGSRRNPLGYDVRWELLGEHDSITVGLDDRTPLRSVELGTTMHGRNGYDFFVDRFETAYRAQMVAFVDAVRRDAPPEESPCSGHDARQALLIALAAEHSLEAHQPVALANVESHVADAAPESGAAPKPGALDAEGVA